jgi:hypothetical protein
MKKLVKVALALNDSDVLFSLEESVGGNLDDAGAIGIIKKDAYSELMKGDVVKEREGYIVCLTQEEYDRYRKQGEID